MALTLESLLTRSDIVGGEIQVLSRSEVDGREVVAVHRSFITAVEMDGNTIHFKPGWTLMQVVRDGEITWIKAENQHLYFSTKSDLIGNERGAVQFEISINGRLSGWAIIFPESDPRRIDPLKIIV